jgi:hypothetical protein
MKRRITDQCSIEQPTNAKNEAKTDAKNEQRTEQKNTKKQKTTQVQCDIAADVLLDFISYKAFDVITEGLYKKQLVRCKENGDEWAMRLYSRVQCVTNCIKSVMQEVHQLHEYGKYRLQTVCNEVISSTIAPFKVKSGWNICMITGTRSDNCIEIGHGNRNESTLTIHHKFKQFVLFLWFITKFEHVIRVLARSWIHKNNKKHSSSKLQCKEFIEENAIIAQLHGIFTCAYIHVMTSLLIYKRTMEYCLDTT